MGLIGIWHRNICKHPARAIIPYDQRLSRFPAYLQQLDMESNGKRVTKSGAASKNATGPLVWGEPGTNGQHAFFQLLHQGTDIIPVEFLIAAEPHEKEMAEHHTLLMANCLAQSQALMKGRTLAEATAQLLAMGKRQGGGQAPGTAPGVCGQPAIGHFGLQEARSLTRWAGSLRFMSTASSSKRQSGTSMPLTNGAWSLARNWLRDLQPVMEGKVSTEGQDSSTAGLVSHLKKLSTRPH